MIHQMPSGVITMSYTWSQWSLLQRIM